MSELAAALVRRFSLRFLGIPGWERLPRFTDLEQTCQALIEAFDGSKRSAARCSVGHFMGVQIRGQRLAELGGARTLFGEQGAHRRGIRCCLRSCILEEPSGLAYIIDSVAKLTKHRGSIPPD